MFIRRLESLRGLAALMVAIHHSLIVLRVDGIQSIWAIGIWDVKGVQSLITKILLIFFNGSAAVSIFFVLSGYVLGLSLDKKQHTNALTVMSFYIKRVCRIYPAHIVSLSIIFIFIYLFHTYTEFPSASTWFNAFYQKGIVQDNVLRNWLLIKVNLNPVAWTLKTEIIISVFFPIAYCISRNVGIVLNTTILFMLIVTGWFYPENRCLLFGHLFYMGLLLPIISTKKIFQIPKARCDISLASSILSLLFAQICLIGINRFYPVIIEAFSASIIILILAYNENIQLLFFRKIIDSYVVKKLGRISYSFYIYHFSVLYWLSYCLLHLAKPLFLQNFPLLFSGVLCIFSILITYFIAGISYMYIERPMIKIGSDISKHLTFNN